MPTDYSKRIRSRCVLHFVMLVGIFCLFADTGVYGSTVYPFYINNQNPFVQIFGLPRPLPAELLKSGQREQLLSLDIVNNTVQGHKTGEDLILDGETDRLTFGAAFSLASTQFSFQVPIIRHTPGRFDYFIRSWHRFFGMSNDEQQQFKANQLNYFYQNSRGEFVNIDTATSGIGDVQFSLARYLAGGEQTGSNNKVIRATVKLPTGDAKKLLGSGAPDASIEIASQNDQLFSRFKLGLYGQAGVLWLGVSDLFPDSQKRIIPFATAAISWTFSRHIVFRSQLDLHGAFYDSEIVDIGGNSVQLTVGGTILFMRQHRFDIGVTENLFSDATPDIGLNLTYRSLF